MVEASPAEAGVFVQDEPMTTDGQALKADGKHTLVSRGGGETSIQVSIGILCLPNTSKGLGKIIIFMKTN
jgi:hypothetical protein